MNSFQLLTTWIVGIVVGVGCVWLLLRAWHRRGSRLAGTGLYHINGQFVEICVGDGCSVTDLRVLFEAIRDDPALSSEALVLFDGRARREVLADVDVHTRLAAFLEILRPQIVPVFAVVMSAGITASALTAQRYAAAVGVRVGLFLEFEAARGWLSACTSNQPPVVEGEGLSN